MDRKHTPSRKNVIVPTKSPSIKVHIHSKRYRSRSQISTHQSPKEIRSTINNSCTNSRSTTSCSRSWNDKLIHSKPIKNEKSQHCLKIDTTDICAYKMTSMNQKKKNLQKKNIILIISFLILVVLAGILMGILIKSKTEQTTSSVPLLRWNTTGITIAGVSGVSGNRINQLNNPWGLAFDSSYNLYIADRFNNRIQKWLRNGSVSSTIAGQANGTAGSSLYDLRLPTFIQFDSSENIYVTDVGNHRIQYWHYVQFQSDQKPSYIFVGVAGNLSNELNQPYGIARDHLSKTLYIADYENHRIMEYKWGQLLGTVVAGGNGPGINQTQLYNPVAVYFDSSSNSLIIVNYGSHNVVRWILGHTSWTLLAGSINGTYGSSSRLLSNPTGVTLDPWGNIYVVDRNNHRIQLFLSGQLDGRTIAGISTINGSDATLMNFPYAVILDEQLNLYVSDRYNHRVQKFLRY